MKAKHRHELKTNELAEWIANFPQWLKENRKIIIYISVVAVVVIGSAIWHWYVKNVESVKKQLYLTRLVSQLRQSKKQILQAQAQGMDVSYILLQTADNLEAAAQNTKDAQMTALALIKRAEALRTELHYRLSAVSEQDKITQINKAKASYTEALEKKTPNLSLEAMAKYGLGLCEEELGNFEQAKQICIKILSNPEFEGTTAAFQASQRLETIADYRQKTGLDTTRMKSEPKPAAIQSLQPEIRLNTRDANLPIK